MKKIAQRLLIVVLILAMIMPYSFAGNNGKGKGRGNNKDWVHPVWGTQVKNDDEDQEASDQLREQLRMMVTYGEGEWGKLPYGFVKTGEINLPPGLLKQFLSGKLPYGIAKKYENWIDYRKDQDDDEDDDDQDDVSKASLNKLIGQAEDLLDDLEDGDFDILDDDGSILDELEDEIDDAKGVHDDPATDQDEVDEAYEQLLEAVEDFKANIIVESSLLDELLEDLLDYQDKYFGDDLVQSAMNIPNVDELEAKLIAMIAEIKSYTEGDEILTQGILDDIKERAKVFVAYNTLLGDLIEDVDEMLEGDIVGDEPGDYPQEAVNALIIVLNAAKVSLMQDDIQDQALAYADLLEALDEFELEILIAIDSENPIFTIYAELALMYDGAFSDDADLQELLSDIEDITPLPFVMTQSAYNELLDRASVYLDGLYDDIVLGLLERVEEAVEIHELAVAEGTHWNGALNELMQVIEMIADVSEEPYELLVEEKYELLMTAMNELNDAIEVFEGKVLISIDQRAELLYYYLDLLATDYPNAADGLEDDLIEKLLSKVKYPEVDPTDQVYIDFEAALAAFKVAYENDPKTYTDDEVEALFGNMTFVNYETRVEAYNEIINAQPPVTN